VKTRVLKVTVEPEELEKLYLHKEKLVIDVVVTHANVKITTKQKVTLKKEQLQNN
jgi:hypothetical protein